MHRLRANSGAPGNSGERNGAAGQKSEILGTLGTRLYDGWESTAEGCECIV